MRANTSLPIQRKSIQTLENFMGVDLTRSPLNISSHRASYMRNFIIRDGVNKKRFGWRQEINLESPIRAIFKFNDNVCVIAKKYLFTYKGMVNKGSFPFPTDASDGECRVFLNDGKAYIIGCGGYYVFDGNTCGKVSDVAYVPTTSIIGTDKSVTTLESPNLLTNKRKNRLIKGAGESQEWTLDAIPLAGSVLVKIGGISYEVTESGTTGTIASSMGNINMETGVVVITPKLAEGDIVEVEFAAVGDNLSGQITGCKFGAIYPYNNEMYLFLSGNPKMRNTDWCSERGDFTYFPTLNVNAVGTNSTAIVGYAKLSDNYLAIFKEESPQEASVWYRTGAEITNSVADRNELVWRTTAGAVGEGIIANDTISNLDGDTIALTRTGVKGLMLVDNIATDIRYFADRSENINGELTQLPLDKLRSAKAISFDSRYYLAVDGKCYVADARFRYTSSNNQSYNYEWWVWDNMPVACWSVIDGELWFGTADGAVCAFHEGFTDRTSKVFKAGGEFGTVNYVDNRITVTKGVKIKEWDTWQVMTPYTICVLYFPYESISQDEATRMITVNYAGADALKEKCMQTYIGDWLSVNGGEKGEVKNLTYGDRSISFTLETNGGRIVVNNSIIKDLAGVKAYITNVSADETNFQIKEYREQKYVDTLVKDNNYPSSYGIPSVPEGGIGGAGDIKLYGVLESNRNVVAEWITPIMDLGSNLYGKTLYGLSIATEPKDNGLLTFGYETKEALNNLGVNGEREFSFNEMNFNDFSFTTGFAHSYTVRVKQRNFNYITMRVKSDSDKNCSLNNMSLIYKSTRMLKGVR